MKKWTLESPGVGVLLHLGLFALVSAAVLYSERHAAPTVAPAPPPVVLAPQPKPEADPQPTQRLQAGRHGAPAMRSVQHELPVPSALSPLRPTP